MEFFYIFINIIVPVFILIGIGAWLHRVFMLDLYTLAKVNVYFLIPGFVFTYLYKTEFSLQLFSQVLLFFLILIVVLYFVVQLISKMFHFNKGVRVVFTNSVLLFNAGNYGVPVNDLVFKHDPFALSIQVIVMTLQNILAYSFGIFSFKAVEEGRLNALMGLFKMPVIYAMAIGILLNLLNVDLPGFITTSGEYIANAMIGIALVTLGAQVAQLKFKRGISSLYISLFVRLLLGPILALSIIYLFGFKGVLAQALFIASGMPSAVNSTIIAQEYKTEVDLAAQIVLLSTILSMVSVTAVIYFSKVLF
ncbi:AEC family transporter [Pseudalkalibacillus caeni]|uniref:AEC family transporter n=1 Tax=Exobacillus caeni TaxID=2574798 RepID=A0A5R9F7U7_9BACL|nr:AEC family transporter [Pseudalkalibacillus caeni]TLS36584.1 AEC family transporter [Pseudalkalibacillus caeni]